MTASKSSSSHNRIPPFVIKATAIASLGGILFGFDMGVISGALPQLTSAFDLSKNQQQLVVGILYLGGGIGAALGGTCCDFFGRKTTIVATDILFCIGAAMLAFATSIPLVIVGRIIMGLGISISGIADVAYLNEMAPTQWRGSIVSVNEACISLGFLLAYVVGWLFSSLQNGWRYMFGVSGIVAILQFMGMMGMPESPLWLQHQGRIQEARQALDIIHGGEQQQADQQDSHKSNSLQQNIHLPPSPSRQHLVDNAATTSSDHSYSSLSSSPPKTTTTKVSSVCLKCHKIISTLQQYYKQAWIALFLSVAQQLTGQTNVLNYAPLIFGQFSKTNDSAMRSTVWIGIVKFFTTVVVILKIETLGRRNLLLGGMSVVIFGLLLLTFAFVMGNSVVVVDNGDEQEIVASSSGIGMGFALVGIMCVVTGYSASFGPLTWLLTSELFPTEIRGRALGASTIITYLVASLATSTFLTAESWFGGYVFLLYAGFTLVGLVFAYLAIPDTAGKSVVEINEELSRMWWWRRDSYNMVESSSHSDRSSMEAELT